jgi:endonuclease YncB( thermonuclease family)
MPDLRIAARSRGIRVGLAIARCLASIAGLAAFGALAATFTLRGTVVSVADGDTITVVDAAKHSHRIRLAAIDAPERAQPFATVSRRSLAAHVMHRDVVVVWTRHDRYGRIVGKVLVGGVDVNLAQVADGMAWHYRQYAREQSAADKRAYRAAEVSARAHRIGLWAGSAPVPPWKFRRESTSEMPFAAISKVVGDPMMAG